LLFPLKLHRQTLSDGRWLKLDFRLTH